MTTTNVIQPYIPKLDYEFVILDGFRLDVVCSNSIWVIVEGEYTKLDRTEQLLAEPDSLSMMEDLPWTGYVDLTFIQDTREGKDPSDMLFRIRSSNFQSSRRTRLSGPIQYAKTYRLAELSS